MSSWSLNYSYIEQHKTERKKFCILHLNKPTKLAFVISYLYIYCPHNSGLSDMFKDRKVECVNAA